MARLPGNTGKEFIMTELPHIIDNTVYYDCLTAPIEVNGLYRPHTTGKFYRLPDELLNDMSINLGARERAKRSAGGRVRFATDAACVTVEASLQAINSRSKHFSIGGKAGIDIYVAERGTNNMLYRQCFFPALTNINPDDGLAEGEIKETYYFNIHDTHAEHEVMLHLTNFAELNFMRIGLPEGAQLYAPRPYAHPKPILAYGSSISQGCAASRPGNVWLQHISRWLDIDTINLGFSGSDKGEAAIAHFIGQQDISLFVMGYEANAGSNAHLKATHRPFYEIVRAAQPDLPILIASMPRFPRVVNHHNPNKTDRIQSEIEVLATYNYGIARGDRNLYFLSGTTMYGTRDQDACIVDHAHPNDLGFMRIAEAMRPAILNALQRVY